MAITGLIGSSAKFRALLDNVDMVAPVDSAVLIQGETGTGKEVIARAIHEAGPHSFEGLQSRDRSLALELDAKGISTEGLGYARA